MLAAGVPAKVVQETLGHSRITLTLDTYTSVYSGTRSARRHFCTQHRIHTRRRAARENQEVPGRTVGRVGLEPTT